MSENTVTDVTEKTSAEQQDAGNAEVVQLTVGDLQLLAQIIDLATRRGAFHATEATQIGGVYNKLAAFLAYVEQTTKGAEDGTSEVTDEQPAAE